MLQHKLDTSPAPDLLVVVLGNKAPYSSVYLCWYSVLFMVIKVIIFLDHTMQSVPHGCKNRSRPDVVRWPNLALVFMFFLLFNLCLYLPTRTSHFLSEGNHTQVLVRSCMWHGSETWPVKKEKEELTLQRAEMRMISWMCGVEVTDRFSSSESRERD